MRYETHLRREIDKVKNHIEARLEFNKEQHKCVPVILNTLSKISDYVVGCDTDRNKRLSAEKQVAVLRKLTYKYCK